MILRRLWLDADGVPRSEEVTFTRSLDAGALHATPTGPFEVDGVPAQGPMRVAAVVDPVCGIGALAENIDAVYDRPPLDGAQIVTRDVWEATVAERRQARETALLERQAGD